MDAKKARSFVNMIGPDIGWLLGNGNTEVEGCGWIFEAVMDRGARNLPKRVLPASGTVKHGISHGRPLCNPHTQKSHETPTNKKATGDALE